MRNISVPEKLRFRHHYLWLFLQVFLFHTPPLRVLDVYGITYNYSYHRVQNSYQLFRKPYFYYFYMSSLPTLAHTLLRVVLFRSVLLLMLQNYKKIVLISHRLAAFRPQCQWVRIFISLTTLLAKRIQLRFKRHQGSHY
jgi:hypothetical protein